MRRQTHRIFVGSQRKKEKETDGREAGKGEKKREREKRIKKDKKRVDKRGRKW